LKLDTLVMIQTKFGFHWSSTFRGEDFWKSLRRTTDDDDGRQVMAIAHLTLTLWVRWAKKGKEINIFKSLARSNIFSTKSEEQEVNLVWPNLCIFCLLFICLYRSWSSSLPNFVWMNISRYQNYRSSSLTGFWAFLGSLSKEVFFL
jgi:hypothetical protein